MIGGINCKQRDEVTFLQQINCSFFRSNNNILMIRIVYWELKKVFLPYQTKIKMIQALEKKVKLLLKFKVAQRNFWYQMEKKRIRVSIFKTNGLIILILKKKAIHR